MGELYARWENPTGKVNKLFLILPVAMCRKNKSWLILRWRIIAAHLKKLEFHFQVQKKKKKEQTNFLPKGPVLFNVRWLKTEFHLNKQKRSKH